MLRDRNRIKRTEESHRARMGRSLDEEELANELGLSQKRLQRTLTHDIAFVESLDREMPGNDNQKYIDFLSDEDAKSPLEMVSLNDWLRSIPKTLEHLSVVERFVISWRFGLVDGDEMTLQEIGECLSLSRERISPDSGRSPRQAEGQTGSRCGLIRRRLNGQASLWSHTIYGEYDSYFF